MARGVFRNLGIAGGGGGVKVLKLYDNGVWNVPYDNAGYRASQYYASEGGWTLNANNMSATMSGTNARNRAIMCSVDFTEWTHVKVKYNNGFELTLSVSSVNTMNYLIVDLRVDSGNHFDIFVSPVKLDYFTSYTQRKTLSNVTFPITVSEILLEKIEPTYLYKDGEKKIIWNNNGTLKLASNYTVDGVVTETDSSFNFPMPTVSAHSRSIVSDSVVDLSGYSSLKVLAVVNNVEHIYSLDISDLQGSYYLSVSTIRALDDRFLTVVASSTKDLFSTSAVKSANNNVGNYAVTVSRIWLEK